MRFLARSSYRESGETTGQSSLKTEDRSEIHRHIPGRSFIAKAALGVSDGLVTNLAFLSGFAGARSDLSLIRFAGVAAMLAGAISMFFGGILAARSELDLFQADVRREAFEIEQEPEEERRELREFYLKKGLTSEEASMVVDRVSSDKRKFLEDLMIHELHLHEAALENPYLSGGVIGGAFLVGALVPLGPYILLSTKSDSLLASLAISLLFLFLVGGWKGNIAGRRFWKGGVETLVVGVAGSAILYLVGSLFGFF